MAWNQNVYGRTHLLVTKFVYVSRSGLKAYLKYLIRVPNELI